MSKQNNNNPSRYKDGTRNHQGEGIPQEHNREEMSESLKAQQSKGEKNFIPGEAPVGEKSKK